MFKYANDCKPISKKIVKRQVVAIDKNTGKVVFTFKSIADAAKHMNIGYRAMYLRLSGKTIGCRNRTPVALYNWKIIKVTLQTSKPEYDPKHIIKAHKNRSWKYHTKGKAEDTEGMINVIKKVMKERKLKKCSFLSMPNIGRELCLLNEEGLIDLSKSVGIEMDPPLFNSMKIAFKQLFPDTKIYKSDINKFVNNTKEKFDVAHLDYCGLFKESEYLTLERVVNSGALTFITVSDPEKWKWRWKTKCKGLMDIHEAVKNFKVVYSNEYEGLGDKVPTRMITYGLVQKPIYRSNNMIITEEKRQDIIKLHEKGLSRVFIKAILHLPHTTDQVSEVISWESKITAKKISAKKKSPRSTICSKKVEVTKEHKKLIMKYHNRGLSAVDIKELLLLPYSVPQISAIKAWVTMRPLGKGE